MENVCLGKHERAAARFAEGNLMLRPKFLLAFLAISAALLAQPAYAHGFGERYDLPVPLSYFMVGGGAAVVLSFAMIGLVVKGEVQRFSYPRFDLIRHTLSRVVLAGPVILPIKLFAVFLIAGPVSIAYLIAKGSRGNVNEEMGFLSEKTDERKIGISSNQA